MPGDVVFIPPKHTLVDQVNQDWSLVKRLFGDALFLNSMRQATQRGGALRQ